MYFIVIKILTDLLVFFDSDHLTMNCRCRNLKGNVSTRPNWDLRVGAPTRAHIRYQKRRPPILLCPTLAYLKLNLGTICTAYIITCTLNSCTANMHFCSKIKISLRLKLSNVICSFKIVHQRNGMLFVILMKIWW